MKPAFSFLPLIRETISLWFAHKAFRLSAALAYYALFSLGPILVIFIGIAGLLLGEQNVRQHLADQIQTLVGHNSTETIQSMINSMDHRNSSLSATIFGGLILLFGAGGVFGQLKDALNTIWEIKPKPELSILTFIRDRFLSFTMVLGTGFLLLVSLGVTTALAAFSDHLKNQFPLPGVAWLVLSSCISIAVVSLLFAMFFKYLPDAQISWRDVGVGALATAILFDLGKFLLGFYLGRESTASSFGAAGAVVMILLWVYYTSLILLLGAEFTRAYARMRGRTILPDSYAIRIPTENQFNRSTSSQPPSSQHSKK